MGVAGNDIFAVQEGSDFLRGGSPEDLPEGGSGNNLLRDCAVEDDRADSPGRVFLTGGQDADNFVYRSPAETVVGADRDQIMDLRQGVDTIVVVGPVARRARDPQNGGFRPFGQPRTAPERNYVRIVHHSAGQQM
ncbi:hypothetical protein [Antarctobacter sp.]|uniref:hypothetical protein n=1 Tax=Antarctobacter sp. TaxID=1872577 RepID=UPI003A924143